MTDDRMWREMEATADAYELADLEADARAWDDDPDRWGEPADNGPDNGHDAVTPF